MPDPSPEVESPPTSPVQTRPKRKFKPVLSLLLLSSLGGGLWWGDRFVKQDLAPTIAKDLSKSLNRPVKLGEVTGYSLTGIAIGPSSIPPHEQIQNGRTTLDQDTIEIKAVKANFNLWQTLWTRTLDLNITLVQPQVYLDQNQQGQWITTELTPPQDSKSWLKTEIKTVRLRQGQIKVQPWGKAARQINPFNGTLTLANQNKTLRLNATGTLDSGGQTTLKADWQQPEQTLKVWANLKELDVPPLLEFAPQLPIAIKAGRVSGDVEARYHPDKPLQLTYKGHIESADTTVTDENIRVQAKRLKTDLQVEFRPKVLPKISGDVQAQNANVWLPEDLFLDNNRQQQKHFKRVNGSLKFLDTPQQQVLFDLRSRPDSGGRLRTKGAGLIALKNQKTLIWPRLNIFVQARNLSATVLDQAYKLPVRFRKGKTNINLLVKLKRKQNPTLQGTATLNNVAGQIEGLPQPFSKANGQLRFRGLTTRFENTTALYGQIPIRGGGWIDPERGFSLQGKTAVMEMNLALGELGLTKLPFPVQGKLQGRNIRVTGALEDPVLTGDMIAPGTTILDEVPFNRLTGQFRLQAPNLTISNIVGTPTPGGSIKGAVGYNLQPGGQVKGLLKAQNIPGDAVARFYNADPGFAIGPVQGPIILSGPAEEIKTEVQFQALQGEYPTQGQVVILNQLARLQNIVAQLPGGNLNINGLIDLPKDRVQANVTIPGLSLPVYDPSLRGQMTGQFALTAPFSTFSLNNATGLGQLRFSEGINLVEDPINAQVGWNGQQLLVQKATAPNFLSTGRIGVDLDGPEGLQLTTMALNVQAQNYDLQRLQGQGLTPIPLTGRADLRGQLTGTVAAPNLLATMRVKQLAVTQLAFESLLSGPIHYRAEKGLDLRLKGNRDRISLALGPDQLPRSFDIKRDQAIALGRPQGQNLGVTLRQFPLEVLNLQAANNLGTLSGLASGDFTANIPAVSLQGQFAINRPGIGKLRGKSFAGSLRYANGVASIADADLAYRDSRYRLTASVAPNNDFEASGQIDIQRGQLADLVSAWQTLTLDDVLPTFGSAADVTTVPVGLPNASLFTQLQRLTEVEQLIAKEQEQEEEPSPIPPLEDLEGQLAGQIKFQGSMARGFQGDFDINSGPIDWQPYSLDQVIAQGQWQDTALSFDTLQAASGNSIAKFQGQVGGQRQGGKLTLANVPIDPLNEFLEFPFRVSGSLEGAATLAGTLADPQVQGRFSITEAALDATPVQQAQADLTYNRGRLKFDGSANINNPEPISLTGNIPYQLPFATVASENDQLDIRLAVQNQGLSALNLFTDQMAWVNGQGNLNVVAKGTVSQPEVTGSLQVNNATIAAQALDAPLTNVTGNIRFERDRIVIADTLSGRYNQGILRASGGLPLYTRNNSTDPSLQVGLRGLDLSLKGLYRGQIGGNLSVAGTAFSPELGGSITLAKGQVILPETSTQAIADGNPEIFNNPEISESEMPLRFKDLKVTVKDTVRVAQPPLLSFSAAGDIILNGSIDNLSPDGILNFQRGTVNLFTSRFRLDRRRDNFAQFTPENGLDPFLSLGMVTTVTDGVASRLSTLNERVALQENPVGNIESVRVRASVEGLASELTRNFDQILELDSTPSRTESEILGLLGGGVTESLAKGNTQLALVNLASTAALTGVEGLFEDIVGSRGSFRVFPVLIPNDDDRTLSTLEFGAEVGYDITNRFSASVLQVVSDLNEPTLFNLNYEINDQFRIRSAVDTDGEAFGVLEYRIRF